jgi:hypothetical protein
MSLANKAYKKSCAAREHGLRSQCPRHGSHEVPRIGFPVRELMGYGNKLAHIENKKTWKCVRLTNYIRDDMVGESMCHTMSPVTWLGTWNDQTMSPVTWFDRGHE